MYGADSKGKSVVIAGSAKPQKGKRLTRQHKSTREIAVEGQFRFNGIVKHTAIAKGESSEPLAILQI